MEIDDKYQGKINEMETKNNTKNVRQRDDSFKK